MRDGEDSGLDAYPVSYPAALNEVAAGVEDTLLAGERFAVHRLGFVEAVEFAVGLGHVVHRRHRVEVIGPQGRFAQLEGTLEERCLLYTSPSPRD